MSKRLPIHEFVALIIGKELTLLQVNNLLEKYHPESVTNRDQLRRRLNRMHQSPHADMRVTRAGEVKKYHLVSVSERYYHHSESLSLAFEARKKSSESVNKSPHSLEELKYCNVHKMFDQALASVQEKI